MQRHLAVLGIDLDDFPSDEVNGQGLDIAEACKPWS
jgi:hypothetical protein